MKIIFFGAPGAGKGTQAEIVSEKLNIPTISTGAIIRSAIKEGTEMGLAAKAKIEAGGLVPDEVVIGIIKERLAMDDCKSGFILDGFPRTVPQAKALTEMGITIDVVLDLEVEIIKQRGPVGTGKALASVGGEKAVSCEITFVVADGNKEE